MASVVLGVAGNVAGNVAGGILSSIADDVLNEFKNIISNINDDVVRKIELAKAAIVFYIENNQIYVGGVNNQRYRYDDNIKAEDVISLFESFFGNNSGTFAFSSPPKWVLNKMRDSPFLTVYSKEGGSNVISDKSITNLINYLNFMENYPFDTSNMLDSEKTNEHLLFYTLKEESIKYFAKIINDESTLDIKSFGPSLSTKLKVKNYLIPNFKLTLPAEELNNISGDFSNLSRTSTALLTAGGVLAGYSVLFLPLGPLGFFISGILATGGIATLTAGAVIKAKVNGANISEEYLMDQEMKYRIYNDKYKSAMRSYAYIIELMVKNQIRSTNSSNNTRFYNNLVYSPYWTIQDKNPAPPPPIPKVPNIDIVSIEGVNSASGGKWVLESMVWAYLNYDPNNITMPEITPVFNADSKAEYKYTSIGVWKNGTISNNIWTSGYWTSGIYDTQRRLIDVFKVDKYQIVDGLIIPVEDSNNLAWNRKWTSKIDINTGGNIVTKDEYFFITNWKYEYNQASYGHKYTHRYVSIDVPGIETSTGIPDEIVDDGYNREITGLTWTNHGEAHFIRPYLNTSSDKWEIYNV